MLKKMICIGTNAVGERCKQLMTQYSNYCQRHDIDDISSFSSDNSTGVSDIDIKLSDLEREMFNDDFTDYGSHRKIEFRIPDQEHLGVVNVDGDGSCFWRALSVCLYGHQDRFDELAEKCIDKKSDEDIINLTWVEFYEIPVISKILKITINIIHYLEEEIYLYICLPDGEIEQKKYPCELNPSSENVYIYFVPGHYTSVVRI